jgi:hypothetical protein
VTVGVVVVRDLEWRHSAHQRRGGVLHRIGKVASRRAGGGSGRDTAGDGELGGERKAGDGLRNTHS